MSTDPKTPTLHFENVATEHADHAHAVERAMNAELSRMVVGTALADSTPLPDGTHRADVAVGPFPCLDTPDVNGWAVSVIRHPDGLYKTVFSVGVQHFTIAQADDDEAADHCEGMRRMFLHALRNLGVTTGKRCAAKDCPLPVRAEHAVCVDHLIELAVELERQGQAAHDAPSLAFIRSELARYTAIALAAAEVSDEFGDDITERDAPLAFAKLKALREALDVAPGLPVAEVSDPYVCPGCYAVGSPCAPGCGDAEIARESEDRAEREDDDADQGDDEDPVAPGLRAVAVVGGPVAPSGSLALADECPNCSGRGGFLGEHEERVTCTVCLGTGSRAPAPCRRCSECTGEEHHWIEDGGLSDSGKHLSAYCCKHCDARADMCDDCDGPDAEGHACEDDEDPGPPPVSRDEQARSLGYRDAADADAQHRAAAEAVYVRDPSGSGLLADITKVTPKARLDASGTAKPLTEIVAVMPPFDDRPDCTVHAGQATHYVARPTATANVADDDVTRHVPAARAWLARYAGHRCEDLPPRALAVLLADVAKGAGR